MFRRYNLFTCVMEPDISAGESVERQSLQPRNNPVDNSDLENVTGVKVEPSSIRKPPSSARKSPRDLELEALQRFQDAHPDFLFARSLKSKGVQGMATCRRESLGCALVFCCPTVETLHVLHCLSRSHRQYSSSCSRCVSDTLNERLSSRRVLHCVFGVHVPFFDG